MREDLVLTAHLPGDRLLCDGLLADSCYGYYGGDAQQQLFVMTSCNSDFIFYEGDRCSGDALAIENIKVCQTEAACGTSIMDGFDCSVKLDELIVTTAAPLDGDTCVFLLE